MTDWKKPGGLCCNCDPCSSGSDYSAVGDSVAFTQNAGYGGCACCLFSTILICFAPCIFGTFCCSANASALFFKFEEDKVNCVIHHKYACSQDQDIELKDIQSITSTARDVQTTETNEDGETVVTGSVQVSAFKIVHAHGTYTSPEFPGADQKVQAVCIKVSELIEKGRQRRGIQLVPTSVQQPQMQYSPQQQMYAPQSQMIQQYPNQPQMMYAPQPQMMQQHAPQGVAYTAAPGAMAPQPQVMYAPQPGTQVPYGQPGGAAPQYQVMYAPVSTAPHPM